MAKQEKAQSSFKIALRGKATKSQQVILQGIAQNLASLDGINSEKSRYGKSGSVSLDEASDVGDEPMTSFTLTLELESTQVIASVLIVLQQMLERMDETLEATLSITIQAKLNKDNPTLDLVQLGVNSS